MISFNHGTHVRLMKESSILAKNYRIDCGLEKKEEEIINTEQNNIKEGDNTVSKDKIDMVVPQAEKEYSRDNLKAILETNNIKYFKGAKVEKLLEICIENKLI